MKRVLVVGSPGSGKSTLTNTLSRLTGIPAHHLDLYFWEPGWTLSSKPKWRAIVSEILRDPSWIIDGQWYSTMDQRLPLADTIIFLDMPRLLCCWRVFVRTFSNLGRVRSGMPDGCRERFDWKFFIYIWTFPTRKRPRIVGIMETFEGVTITLRSPQEVRRFLSQI